MSAVIDGHATVGSGRSWYEPEADVRYQIEELLERGSEAGVDRYLIHTPRCDDYPAANRMIAKLCEKQPDKLTGVAVHDPGREAGRLRSLLDEEVRNMGLRAVRSDGQPNRELMDAAQALRIPVLFYPEQTPYGMGPARPIHNIVQAYPEVDLILPHLGNFCSITWWAHMEAIDLAKRYPNLYLGTSGVGSFKYLELAANDLPAKKLIFGTCAPELDPRVEIYAARLLKLLPAQESEMLGGSIERLLAKSGR